MSKTNSNKVDIIISRAINLAMAAIGIPKDWRYISFNSSAGAVTTPWVKVGVGGAFGTLEVEKIKSMKYEFACVSTDASVGIGSPVSLSIPNPGTPGAGFIATRRYGTKVTGNSFTGVYAAATFGGGFINIAAGTTILFMGGRRIVLPNTEMFIKIVDNCKMIVVTAGGAVSTPNAGVTLSIGWSHLINKQIIPSPSVPIGLIGDGPADSPIRRNYQIHTVVSGDWLSKIAIIYYGDLNYWKRLYTWRDSQGTQPNLATVGTNPDLIYPGMEIIIPPKSELDKMPPNGYM